MEMHTYIKKTGQKEGTNKAELKPNSNNQKQLRDKDLKKTRVHRGMFWLLREEKERGESRAAASP